MNINPDRLLQTFLELVQIDSPSNDEAAISAHLRQRLARLGLDAHADEMGNLIAHRPGNAGGDWLLLNAHMDTVGRDTGIRPVVRDGIVTSDGTTILGSDDKSGVAAILEVLQTLMEQGAPHPPLEVVFTVQEETGLFGAMRVVAALRARQGVVLDSGGPIGKIVVSAPAEELFTFTVHGRAAHAAAEPEKGINAIRAAAEAIAAMPLGRIDPETTANIGLIQGGMATNIVPDTVTARGEARSRNADKLQRQVAAMTAAVADAARRHGATADIRAERAYESFHLPNDAPIVQRVARAMRALGKEPLFWQTGGGSDANIFNAHGVQTVIISTGMANVHTKDECIAVADLVDAARSLWHIVTG